MKSGNEIVDKTSTLQIGYQNSNWYKTLKSEKGNTNFLAVSMLQDFIYWYKWTEIRDENTGNVIAYKKKFKDDLYLQRSYPQLVEEFYSSKKQVYDAIVILESKGLIKRHFRDITVNCATYRNIMYIEIMPENIYKMTYGEEVPTYKLAPNNSKVNTTPPICPNYNHIPQLPPTDTNHSDEVTTSSDNAEEQQENKQTEQEPKIVIGLPFSKPVNTDSNEITNDIPEPKENITNTKIQAENRTMQIVRKTYETYRLSCPRMPECNITDSLCRCVIATIKRYSEDKIRECLSIAGKSQWLNNPTTSFRCDFKWIFRNTAKGLPTNVDKILEGYYNRGSKGMAFQEGNKNYSDTTSWRNEPENETKHYGIDDWRK
jgi:hypothetical protein